MLLCVSFGLTNQVWNYFEYCLCKTYFVFEFLKGEWLKILILGKLGLKFVFWKNISSHTHVFLFLIFNALRGVFKNQVIFSKKCFSRFSIDPDCFLINRNLKKKFRWAFVCFDWSKFFFDQSNIVNHVFLKIDLDFFKNTFSKFF